MMDPTPDSTSETLEDETFALDYVVTRTGAPSEDWLMRRIRSGDIPACKSGRHWRMTRSDMAAVVAHMKFLAAKAIGNAGPAEPDLPSVATVDQPPAAARVPRRTGLTDRARRNLARSA